MKNASVDSLSILLLAVSIFATPLVPSEALGARVGGTTNMGWSANPTDTSTGWTRGDTENIVHAIFVAPTEDPVAYYPFNGNANDESGNGNDGTVFGAVLTVDRFGNASSAYSFDGVDDYIFVDDDPTTDFPVDFTIAAWIKHSGAGNPKNGEGWRIVSKQGNSSLYHVRVAGPESNIDDGLIEFEMAVGGGPIYEASSQTNVKDDMWHFVVSLRRGTNMEVYVDGTKEGAPTGSGNPIVPETDLSIGSKDSGVDNFDGLIDDIRIYNRALSQEEILDLYNEVPSSDDPLARFGVCYGGTGSANITNPGTLITIDPLTGAGTLIGPSGILGTSIPALAIKSTGEIYTLSATSNSNLYAIDASTGAGTFVANTGLNTPDALAFDANDVLYAVSNNNNLNTVDVNTGATTFIGPVGFTTKALSYDPTDGTMYGSSADDRIYTVDLTTGASTLVGTIGIGGSTHALRFDQEGNMFGTKGSPTTPYTLISIDKATGVGTTIGPIGFTAVLGLASRVLYTPPAVPVTVEVEIDSLLKFVPAEGDTFPYTVTVTNHTSLTQVVDWWTKVLRPIGNPIDPLSGPEVLVLNRFQTVVIDTPLIPLPFNARTGDYSLIGFIGRYLADTLDTDTTDFHKLPAIACDEISRFQARCRPGGTVQARIILTNANHTGDLVEFTIDGVSYETTVGSNRRALISLSGFNIGSHDVELTEPPGCYPPATVVCPAGLAKGGDDSWDDEESWEVPVTTALLENYPDPFNPSTTIRYSLSEDAHVSLKVYNMLGQLVATLVDEAQAAGYRSVVWNGRNESGASISSGIYIYRMTAGAFTATKRMLLLK